MEISEGKLLSEVSTFGIGGPAKFFTSAKTSLEMKEALLFAKEKNIPFLVIGMGSNLLFDDRGYAGLIIRNEIRFIKEAGKCLHVGSGLSLAELGLFAIKRSLSGVEEFVGIPATVGGAVYMNAGAHGKSISEIIHSVEWMNSDLAILELEKDSLKFDYRFSSFHSMKGSIIGVKLSLKSGTEIGDKIRRFLLKRTNSQPLDERSAGSVFKNPSSEKPAGLLIDRCGLKGEKRGGAAISLKHANFIVNRGAAKAEDVLSLIRHVQKVVFEKENELLKMEICYIPYEG